MCVRAYEHVCVLSNKTHVARLSDLMAGNSIRIRAKSVSVTTCVAVHYNNSPNNNNSKVVCEISLVFTAAPGMV